MTCLKSRRFSHARAYNLCERSPAVWIQSIRANNGSDLTMPDTSTDDQALAAEFDVLANRAGLPVAEAHKAALLQGYKDLKRMTALLRRPRTAADEPAGAYAILSVTRSI
jgi:hypothetical protein